MFSRKTCSDVRTHQNTALSAVQCPKVRWRQCEACQKRIRDEGLEDEFHLQSWFVGRINTFLKAQGRVLIGWDEILEGGLSPGAVVMSWRVNFCNSRYKASACKLYFEAGGSCGNITRVSHHQSWRAMGSLPCSFPGALEDRRPFRCRKLSRAKTDCKLSRRASAEG